ncbi:jun dimerization protein 2-like [Pristis pectinata]|uniref:jun dimerization protein 2-like n=1 Tax=Pristis pectinata TaxID=685728 RepID=UPI00223CE1B8|nr:jun dimerization protein 2-like [Pristis pectinata]
MSAVLAVPVSAPGPGRPLTDRRFCPDPQGEWEDDERRRRRREKNKVAAARCRNKKRERTEFLQKESERLELMNGELKSQIEELKRERQELMYLLNRHRPTCIVRTDSVRSPDPVLLQ